MLVKRLKPLLFSASLASQIVAKAVVSPAALVKLPYGSFEGKESGRLIEFLALPFAAPPVGKLRFEPPSDPIPFDGIRQATAFAPACPQVAFKIAGLPLPTPANSSEDCLYLNVIRPANISHIEKLPVIVKFATLGGFFSGDTGKIPGDTLVNRSIDLGAPVLLVTTTYRLNAFGFLGGKEIKAAGLGNVGLRDQRFALQWIQTNIAKFGGDPSKVTIWGESAGAISVGMHMLLNDGNTNGLFRGGIMESGSPLVLPDILNQQKHFDAIVADTNCTNAADRLECLRDTPLADLVAAVQKRPDLQSYEGLKLTWQPMVDGNMILRDPQTSLQEGKFANIPVISGTAEDEGTVFSQSLNNITTNADFLGYVKSNYFNEISDEDLHAVEVAYPDDVTQGSPFNTGTANVFFPQYKRLAAFQGDLVFQAPRRFFSAIASKRQPVYGYRYLRARAGPLPRFGVMHAGDLPEFMAVFNDTGFTVADALIYFTCKGDPNPPQDSISLLRNTKWDVYSSSIESPPLLAFVDPGASVNITSDNDRVDAMKLINKLSLKEVGRSGV